ncbi:MAG: hypothetical protein QOF82_1407, partial [Frankiales bacterium]|nr:hypothetical protein [Frankiales bacterium]
MSRRVSLPGAAELFRVTGDAEPAPAPAPATAAPARPEAAVRAVEAAPEPRTAPASRPVQSAAQDDWETAPARSTRRRRPAGA